MWKVKITIERSKEPLEYIFPAMDEALRFIDGVARTITVLLVQIERVETGLGAP